MADDRLVLDPQRVGEGVEIGFLGGVVFVLHRRGDDARRGRGEERLDEAVGLVEHGAEIFALGVDAGRVEIAHRADRLGRLEVADRGPAGHLLLEHGAGRSDSGRRRRAAAVARRRRSRSSDAARTGRSPRAAARRCCRRRCRPRSAWARPSAAPALPAASSSAGSTASPCARRTYSRTSSGGRGRLPACVVRIRSSLRRMAPLSPSDSLRRDSRAEQRHPMRRERRAPTAGPASPAARRSGRQARDTRRHKSSAGAFAREPVRHRSPARWSILIDSISRSARKLCGSDRIHPTDALAGEQ